MFFYSVKTMFFSSHTSSAMQSVNNNEFQQQAMRSFFASCYNSPFKILLGTSAVPWQFHFRPKQSNELFTEL